MKKYIVEYHYPTTLHGNNSYVIMNIVFFDKKEAKECKEEREKRYGSAKIIEIELDKS